MPIKNPSAKKPEVGFNYEVAGPKHAEWHRNRRFFRRVAVGGYGSGKSYMCLWEILYLILNTQTYGGTECMIVARDAGQCENVILPIIKRILKGNAAKKIAPWPKRSYSINMQMPIKVTFENGAKIIMLTHKSEGIDGHNPAIVFLDEANKCPESVYLSLENRIGRDGDKPNAPPMFIIAANPTNTGHWLWTRFYQHKAETGEFPEDSYGETFSLLDSKHVSETRKKAVLQTYQHSPLLYKMAVEGQFMDMTGQIFDNFNPDVHVLKVNQQPVIPDHWPRYAGLDFGFQDPTAFVVGAYDPESRRWYIIDTYKQKSTLLKNHAKNIIGISSRHVKRPVIYSDHDTQTRSEYAALGVNTSLANKEFGPGVDAINQLFFENRLFIFEHNGDLIQEILAYHWDDKKKDRPATHQEDHLTDALRYCIYSINHAGSFQFYLPGDVPLQSEVKTLKFQQGTNMHGEPIYYEVPINNPVH